MVCSPVLCVHRWLVPCRVFLLWRVPTRSKAAGKEDAETEKKAESASDNGAQDGAAAVEEQLKQKDAKIKELTVRTW